jgi:hypothetical protein
MLAVSYVCKRVKYIRSNWKCTDCESGVNSYLESYDLENEELRQIIKFLDVLRHSFSQIMLMKLSGHVLTNWDEAAVAMIISVTFCSFSWAAMWHPHVEWEMKCHFASRFLMMSWSDGFRTLLIQMVQKFCWATRIRLYCNILIRGHVEKQELP